MRQFFLFQKTASPAWSPAKKALFWIWNLGVLLTSGVGVCLISLMLATGHYAMRLIFGYFECPLIFVLNLLPVLALLLLLYGLTGRAQLSFGVTAALVFGLSTGNYYKLMFRNDPLMFADLLLLKEAGDMAGKYHLFLDWKLGLMIACWVFGVLFLHFLVRGRPRGRGRGICALAGVTACTLLYPVMLDSDLYNQRTAYYARLNNIWSATQQYIARGFLYPFLHSISEAIETPPENYSADRAEAILSAYSDADIPEEEKVNIIGIMLEAYSDFSRLGVPELAADVYEVWHNLEAEGYSGDLVTNIFAGGTINTERCFLTGFSNLVNFRARTNSYAWYFRSQGYRVEGMHPCYEWFYNRLNVNESLGFEDYYFVENYFSPMSGGGVALDDIFFPELLKTYQAAETPDQPYFSFSVTYQGHGPYNDDVCWWGEKGDYVADNGAYTEAQQYILDNYFGSIYNTNQHLKALTDYLRTDDEPVVLLLFGDHMPWMGDGNSVYEAMGLNLDLSTQEGFFNYYGTRYLIWANDAAKEVLGQDFTGEGPALSPNFLMNQVFRLCGWEGPAFMQATQQVMDRVPVINTPTGLYVENGTLTGSLSPEGQALVEDYNILQYYYRSHFIYSDVENS
ncbi:LTA synthase family protein [uncultured Intestinimonas sp.]|uniref:LTA synthase family protein n=1 Tax=uncultured Intestinimonas sp. TaxID=1689265 RepID=UPI0025D64775|nr:LTA synthase family protein [uncultured Intestinimonas sp.]